MNITESTGMAARGANPEYVNPVPGRIPIVACSPWIERSNNSWNVPTEDDFRMLKSCGFNVAMFTGTNADKINTSLSLAKDAGVPCIFLHYIISTLPARRSRLPTISGSPALTGYVVKDEPYFKELEDCPNVPDDDYDGWVRRCFFYTRYLAPDKLLFMTLVYVLDNSDLQSSYLGKIKTYPEYLRWLQSEFHPNLWTYDVYPINAKGGITYCTSDRFYGALKDFRDISLPVNSGRPFWAYCMSAPHIVGAQDRYLPAPTIGNLRYEAFSALAYGAQGIVYFTYTQRNNSGEEYLSAPINRNGQRTDIWYTVRTVNSEIAQYSRVFLGCSVVKTLLCGPDTQASDISKFLAGSPVASISFGEEGVLLSHVINNGRNYLVIVSRDPFHPKEITVRYVTAYFGRFHIYELTSNFLANATIGKPSSISYERTLTLEAGGYAILRWNAKY